MSFNKNWKTKAGPWTILWEKVPAGREGKVKVEISEVGLIEVQWKKDADGLWLELPNGWVGFDIRSEKDEDSKTVSQVLQRGQAHEWVGVKVSRGDEDAMLKSQKSGPKASRVRAQMPGKIIRVLTQAGAVVEKGQPLLVMEAMKMENEIRASVAGKIAVVHVKEGQAVESGADLIGLEATS